ncbi:MAG TPA: homoserine O-acetyltransferase [Chitinophagaceae bacterium]|nr:homoserine O-acetyltransferase [Chitinophagaceae bacterium]
MPQLFTFSQPFLLESGRNFSNLKLAYTTYGSLNKTGDNVVWVFHALTANSDPAEWWYGLVGDGCLLNPDDYFIVCVNMPGSCYGSSSPLDIEEETGKPYYHGFPLFTTRDMIRAYQHLKNSLGISKIHIGIGGSMGGQQLLEWAIEEPELFQNIIPIATNAQHSPWGIAFNATQRFCIEQDSSWKEAFETAGLEGMKTARAIALLSYRNYHTYSQAQHGATTATKELSIDQQIFNAETYQRYQGEKLAKRFNAFSYYGLSKGMDAHDVGRGRGSASEALQNITAATLIIAIESDILFPVEESRFLAQSIPGAVFHLIDSTYGHDGFLLEFSQISEAIKSFLIGNFATNSRIKG